MTHLRRLAVIGIMVSLAISEGAGFGANATENGWTSFGVAGNGVNEFAGPVSISVSAAGHIFVTDARNSRIVRINDITGRGWTTFGTRGTAVNQFSFPFGIFVDAKGQIFVADIYRIVRINDMDGTGWITFGTRGRGVHQFIGLTGIFVTPAGEIFAVDTGNHRIVRINDMTGRGWTTFGAYGTGIGQFNYPTGIFVNAAGQIFVSDTSNHRLVRIDDMSGTGWTEFDTYTVPGEMHRPWSPTNVSVNSAGQIFMTDRSNQRIVRINDMAGTETTIFGTGPLHNIESGWAGIFLNAGGEIFLADFARNRIMHATALPASPGRTLGNRALITSPGGSGFLFESHPLAAQDLAKGVYEGPLGRFIVSPRQAADFPPCNEPYRPAKNYKKSDLYFPFFGTLDGLWECSDGRIRFIEMNIQTDTGEWITLGTRYFAGDAKVPFEASLDRLTLLTVGGKPAIAKLPLFDYLRLAVIERFPTKDRPGIMVFVDETHQSLEETVALLERVMRR